MSYFVSQEFVWQTVPVYEDMTRKCSYITTLVIHECHRSSLISFRSILIQPGSFLNLLLFPSSRRKENCELTRVKTFNIVAD